MTSILNGVEVPDRTPPTAASPETIERLVLRCSHFDPLVRARAHTALHALEARERQRLRAENVAEGLADTITLARARGETVEAPVRGPVRIASRDVLGWMFGRQGLTADQFRAGRAFQRLYERCDPERCLAPIQLGGRVSGRGGDSDAFAEQLAQAGDDLSAARKLCASLPDGKMVLAAVDWCAGASKPISALASTASRREAYANALRRGLDALAAHWRIGA
jgi:hypothetical protein